MHRFFTNYLDKETKCFIITGPDVNHIKNVLRMKEKDKIEVVSDKKTYICSIEAIESNKVEAKIIYKKEKTSESNIKIHLFQSLPKSSKMETILQKNTELGVYSFFPILSDRSIVKLDDKKEEKKLQRWMSIVEEAAKQSKRDIIPQVHKVMSFKEGLKVLENKLILVPYELEESLGIKDVLKSLPNVEDIYVFIGPEGGFEEGEIKSLVEVGAKIVSLGPRILRTETAGFITSSLIQYELGDIGVI